MIPARNLEELALNPAVIMLTLGEIGYVGFSTTQQDYK